MRNKCKIFILPTEDKTNIAIQANGVLKFCLEVGVGKYQHMYVTDDSNIEDDDWCICEWSDGSITVNLYEDSGGINKLKIIATTDKSLKLPIPNSLAEYPMSYSPISLPTIQQDFIKRYCTNPVDEVIVEYKETFDLAYVDRSVNEATKKVNVNISPKLKNNCIIIHLVEEKMYSKEEVVKLVRDWSSTINIDIEDVEDYWEDWIKEKKLV